MSDSDVKGFCRRVYHETIDKAAINEELKRSLRVHERVPVFIDNMAREIKSLTWTPKRETIEQMVRDMTGLFINAVERKATERRMSDVERFSIQKKHDDAEEFRQQADSLLGENTTHEETKQDENGFETTKETVEIDSFDQLH